RDAGRGGLRRGFYRLSAQKPSFFRPHSGMVASISFILSHVNPRIRLSFTAPTFGPDAHRAAPLFAPQRAPPNCEAPTPPPPRPRRFLPIRLAHKRPFHRRCRNEGKGGPGVGFFVGRGARPPPLPLLQAFRRRAPPAERARAAVARSIHPPRIEDIRLVGARA